MGRPQTARTILQAYPQAGEGLANEIVSVAGRLGIPDPGWLANLINFETAGSFSPSKRNPHSGATGLIQFMPETAEGLGTTTDALAQMGAVEQMEWVHEYLSRTVRGSRTLEEPTDLYMAVFFPAAMGQGEDYSIYDWYVRNRGQSRADTFLRQNNGIRTAGDYARKANERSKLPTGLEGGVMLAGVGARGTPWWAWGLLFLATIAIFQQTRRLKRRIRHRKRTESRLYR